MPAISHTRVWLILLAITAATYWIGEAGLSGHDSMGPVLAMFALAFVKGVLVCLDFLELRHAPALWRWLVVGWLALVLALILLAYWVLVNGFCVFEYEYSGYVNGINTR